MAFYLLIAFCFGSLSNSIYAVKVEKPCRNISHRTSLTAQWKRIHLAKKEMWARSLVWEDPTRCGAPEPTGHNYCACVSGAHRLQQPLSPHSRACGPQGKPPQGEACSPQLEEACVQQQRPSTAKKVFLIKQRTQGVRNNPHDG